MTTSDEKPKEEQPMKPNLGLTPKGGIRALADPSKFDALRVPNTDVAEVSPCTVEGTLADYAASLAGNEEHLIQLRNNVRKCGVCGKPCGFTLKFCNGCNAPLPLEVVHTDNIFMAFVYGVEKGARFPYSISLRKQTEEVLVFDDPLALTACHFCAIPTTMWCADWRLLLRDPAAGLKLLQSLEDHAWSCIEEQFLTRPEWCAKHIAPDKIPKDDAMKQFIRDCVCTGCNFPPSQFQLHIQYFLMPWQPMFYRQFLDKGSLVYKRWFPLAYMKEVLALNDPMPEVEIDTPLEDVLSKYNDRVSYDEHFEADEKRVDAAHQALGNWLPEDFKCTVEKVDDVEVVEGEHPEGMSAKQMYEADKKTLHSSGPTRTYYKYARKEKVPEFGRK